MNKVYFCFPNFKKKAVTLSYDDCVRQDKRLIDIMQKYGLKGTFNINSGLFNNDTYNGVEDGRMTKDESLALYADSGMEVASHGYIHLSLAEVDSAVATLDVIKDREILEHLFSRVIKGMAYANGSYNDEVVDILKRCGVSYARTIDSTHQFDLPQEWLKWHPTCHHDDPNLMELTTEFVNKKSKGIYWFEPLQVFYLWGHSFEFDKNDNWEVIEQFAEFIGGREDIWYATNFEIFNYIQACKRLEFSADAKYVYNPSSIDVYIDWLGKKTLIPSGAMVVIAQK